MRNIVVLVEDLEVARTALNWALQNLIRHGDLITLLHVFPSTRSRSKKKLRFCRLKGFQLALSFKDICDRIPDDAVVSGQDTLPSVTLATVQKAYGVKFPHPVTKFTEDFDFMAMNEKFKKDEVWGHLGKNKGDGKEGNGDDSQDEEDEGSSAVEAKPVYVKDEFFDSISCNSLDHGSRNGRTRFSEQMKIDTETFGDFPRHRGGRGGRGPGRGGRARGSYYGRGYGPYGYAGRGRGHSMSSRPI